MKMRKCSNMFRVTVLGTFVFSAVTATAGTILSDSFESPVVTGKEVTTAPDGWVRPTGTWDGRAGLANVDSGVFTTPYGSQAANIWRDQGVLTTEDSTWSEGLVAGITYTVSFNVAKGDGLDGKYKVDLIALALGEYRNEDDAGTRLAYAYGTATTNDMSETVSFNYTAPADSPDLGKMLALQLEAGGYGALIDNLVLSNNAVGDVTPPALYAGWPKSGATWVPINTTLEATFNEDVTIGSGNIEIRKASDDSLAQTIAIDDSSQVSQSGRMLTIDPSVDLEYNVAYYILFDSGTIRDLDNNDFELTNPSLWTFTTAPADGPREVFYEDFESPEVSGQGPAGTLPPGWTYTSTHSSNKLRVTLYNEDTGDFSTPYGAQAFYLAYHNYAGIVTDLGTITDVYQAGVTYTLKFNVAARSDDVERNYKVQLMSFNEGDPRAAISSPVGTIVAEVTGTVTYSDMRETSGIVFTVPEGADYIGNPVDIRLIYGAYFLLDNLKLTDDKPPETAAGMVIFVK